MSDEGGSNRLRVFSKLLQFHTRHTDIGSAAVNEKREFGTPGHFESRRSSDTDTTDAHSTTDTGTSDDESDLSNCLFRPFHCFSHLFDHDKRDRSSSIADKPDDEPAMSEDMSIFKAMMKCKLLEETCASGLRPCACNLVKRCNSATSSFSDAELNVCLLGDGPHPAVVIEDDKLIRCVSAAHECMMVPEGCGCPLYQGCLVKPGSAPSWKSLDSCYYSLPNNNPNDDIHVPPKHRRDVDDDDDKSIRCSLARDACADDGKLCACRLAARCDNPDVDGPSKSDVAHCLFFGHNDDDENLLKRGDELDEKDSDQACKIAEDQCSRGSKWCACHWNRRCHSGDHLSRRQVKMMKECLNVRDAPASNDINDRDGVDADNSQQKGCSEARRQCKQGSQCACHWTESCKHAYTTFSDNAMKQMKQCLHIRNVPRDDPSHLLNPNEPMSEGQVETITTLGVTMVMSVSKASPLVIVDKVPHATIVESIISTDPVVAELTGYVRGEPFATTVTGPPHVGGGGVEARDVHARNAQGDNSPPLLTPTLSDARTMVIGDVTYAASVSKTSPLVMVETFGADGGGATQVWSMISTNPEVMVMTGTWAGELVGSTQTLPVLKSGFHDSDAELQRRAVPTEAAKSILHEVDAATFTALGATAAYSVDYNGIVVTYGEGTDAGTLAISAIETDPPVVVVSGSWDDAALSPTTLDLEFLQDWLDTPEPIEEYLKDEYGSSTARDTRPSLTPGAEITTKYQVNGQPASVVYSIAATSPLVIVEKYFNGENARTHTQTFPAGTTPPVSKRGVGAESGQPATASVSTTTVAVVGNNSTPYFRATDSEGKPIYVTRTGDYAASTETLNFSESVPAATTTRKGEIVEVRVITKTVPGWTVTREPVCTRRRMTLGPVETVLDLGTNNTNVLWTNTTQIVDGTHYRYADPHAHATLTPLLGFDGGHEQYPRVTMLNKHNVGEFFSRKLRAEVGGEEYNITTPTQTFDNLTVVMHTLAQYMAYDPVHHRVAPTPACVNNKGVYGLFGGWGKKECMIERCMWKHMKPIDIKTVFPASMYDDKCDPMTAYFTQHTRLEDPHWGTTKADKTYYPATPAVVNSISTKTGADRTARVHVYPTCALKRQYPNNYNKKDMNNRNVVGDPECSDMESCHRHCRYHHGASIPKSLLLALVIGLPLLIGIPILAVLLCCLPAWLLHRRRRDRARAQQDPNALTNEKKERRPSVMDKLRRKSTGQPGGVVNAATGQVTNPATGRPLEGGPAAATAIIAGSAAGAAAASGHGDGDGSVSGKGGAAGNGNGSGTGSGDSGAGAAGEPSTKVLGGGAGDGKGTLGRQAEEGRSRVHFDEAPKAAAEVPKTVVTEAGAVPKAVAEREPHVESVPGKTDGTSESASGREWVDVGSMRGRKRARGDRPPGFGHGF